MKLATTNIKSALLLLGLDGLGVALLGEALVAQELWIDLKCQKSRQTYALQRRVSVRLWLLDAVAVRLLALVVVGVIL